MADERPIKASIIGLHVFGVQDPTQEWLRMRQIWQLCKQQRILPPKEVQKFFDNAEPPLEHNILTNLIGDPSVSVVEDHDREGYEILLPQVPKGIKIVRVYRDLPAARR